MLKETIKRLCKAQGKRIYQMERDLGLSRNSVSRWDENKPSVDKVCAVADYLGVTVDSIVKGEQIGGN